MRNKGATALIWLGSEGPCQPWGRGPVQVCGLQPESVSSAMAAMAADPGVEHLLLWDARLGWPDASSVERILERPGDLWHAGLALGTSGKPVAMDFVLPTWMLNRDPAPDISAASWRVSLRACLVKTEVVRRMGVLRPGFGTLLGAGLEWGHRLITRGVLLRHEPELLPAGGPRNSEGALPVQDELRFARYRFSAFWYRWAALRAFLSGVLPRFEVMASLVGLRSVVRQADPAPFRKDCGQQAGIAGTDTRVTVLLPTIERYPYLRVLLDQLRRQTVPPHEIIVIDQTPKQARDERVAEDFADLPLKLIRLDEPGQCRSRNAGLELATGDFILFLDDDDEVEDDLISRHLAALCAQGTEVSCGVADEAGAGPLPEAFTFCRTSDVFPTNNTMIRREVLSRSGMFDLAYDRGQRADGDLGMRVYLSGVHMVLNPGISVLHHHAPRGGLRTHKARVVTYASSRQSLTQRHLPSVSEIYLARRYFTPRQVRESLWIRVLSTLRCSGSRGRQALKFIVALMQLPHTLAVVRERRRNVDSMLEHFPQIPAYEGQWS